MGCSAQIALIASAAALLCTAPVRADVELKKKTVEAYDHYVRVNNDRMKNKLVTNQPFLWFEAQPPAERREIETQLRAGEVAIRHIALEHEGKKLQAPDGLIHHWQAAVFIPGAKVADVLALVQDYDNHFEVYKPEVVHSRKLSRNGDEFKVFFRFLKKKVLTVVLNTDHEVRYQVLSPQRALSRSWTTRVQEVQDPDKPGEREKPIGKDGGFLWRLDTWWRFEERDGGTYVACESVSLSRDIPFGLGWMIGPFVKSVPKESLMFSLGRTRSTLLQSLAQAKPAAPRPSPSN